MAWSILLVEDEPDIRHVVQVALARDPRFAVTICTCATEAVALARREGAPFDCVLLDYFLPDMDHAKCLAGLRAGPATRSASIVLLTAFSPRGDQTAPVRDGIDAVILKPFDVLALGDQVAAILSGESPAGAVHDRSWRSARR